MTVRKTTRNLIAASLLILTALGSQHVQAAHERTIPVLLNKIQQSALSAQAGMQTNQINAVDRGLGNAYVQGMAAMVQARAEQKQFKSLGQLVDPSQPGGPFNNINDAFNQLFQSITTVQQAYQAKNLQSTVDNLYWVIAATEYIYYQRLQNGNVNPNGARVPGVGGFLEFDGNIAYMAGVIDDRITNRVSTLLSQRNIKTVVIVNVPGSNDDNSNTAAALRIRQAGINTHILNGGAIESGGVDFFLAGKGRSVSQNFNIGVHSWAGGGTSGFQLQNDRNNNNHRVPFLNYYRSIGIQDAFYFFTITFRPETMHYMTVAELNTYGVVNATAGGNDPQPPTPPNPPQTGLAGVWTEVRNDGRSKTITIQANGAFSEIGFDNSTFTGTAQLNGNQLTIRGNDNSVETLTLNMTPNRINFPGQTFHWIRKNNTPPPATFNIAGNWTEVRTDGRQNKAIQITGNQFREFQNGVQSFSGTITVNGQSLTLRGNDNSVETFRMTVSQNGKRIDFANPNTGARITRFHWVKQ